MSTDVWNQKISGDSFPTLSIGYLTTLPADIPSEPVYEYNQILMENYKKVRDAHAVLAQHGPDFATTFLVKNGEVPVHPGTEKYYKENDLWSDDLTSLKSYRG